jgi:hypothetical protein
MGNGEWGMVFFEPLFPVVYLLGYLSYLGIGGLGVGNGFFINPFFPQTFYQVC